MGCPFLSGAVEINGVAQLHAASLKNTRIRFICWLTGFLNKLMISNLIAKRKK